MKPICERVGFLLYLQKKNMTEEKKQEIKETIKSLESQLTGDMMKDMAIRDQIHNLEMKLNGTKPTDSHFDCVGCGS